MADTTRQQIVTAVETRLKTISVAHGYQTALGAHVFTWREENSLKFECECYAHGSTTAAQARLMLDDVVKCIGVDQTWGRLARYTLLDSHEIDLEQNAEIIGGVKIEFTVVYRTNQWTT